MRPTVPKNIKGAKADDGAKCLIFSTNVFKRGRVWNTFRSFFGGFFGDLEHFGTPGIVDLEHFGTAGFLFRFAEYFCYFA